jgi:protein SCO1/2
MIAAVLFAVSLVPMHGVVVEPLGTSAAAIRNDEIPSTLAAGTRRLRIEPTVALRAGTEVDGLLDRSTTPWTLRETSIAAPFAPGLPDAGRVVALDIGKTIPYARFVDQRGTPIDLSHAFAGKTLILSFVFTRCPDRTLCPAISGKFAYLQAHLDPRRFALAEITLDPQYDSPAILRAYGAQYGAIDGRWSLLTATGSTTQRVLDEFGINSLRVSAANFIHNDKLFIVTPQGRIAYVAETAGWDPDGVVAEASSVAGMASNPFERFKLSLIASVVALCGGSQFAGIVFLELALFFLILVIVTASLWWVGRVLWGKP